MKYLVMECHEKYAVLLDEEAGFVKARNTGLTVGETIEDPQLLKASPSRRNIIMKVTCGLAAAAACFAVVVGIRHYQEYLTPYSNIRMTINPDVELVLNHHGQVLSVEGLNEDGRELIEGYEPERRDKLQVADDLIERAIDMGYLSDNAVIIFDIDTPDDELMTQYGIELRSETAVYTSKFDNVNVVIIDRDDDYEYSDEDYEPIVIPVIEQTEAETAAGQTALPESDSGYEENDDGDNERSPEEGMSNYGGNTNTAPPATAPPATAPPATAPPATAPPATAPPATAPPAGDSGYEAGSSYGDSGYEAASNYGDSGY